MMPAFLPSAARDRRLWLLLLCALLAAILGFVSLKGQTAIGFLARTGYWFMLASFLLFLRSLWRCLGAELRGGAWRGADKGTLALVLACGTILLVHEAPGFKIVMDEIMLLGTSMSMHFDRAAVTPLRGNDIQGAFVLMDGIVDKRPLFFPFLLSVLHDVSGYRPANSFVLNGMLGYVFLWLVSLIGGRLAGRPGAWLSVLLFAGLPLLAQNVMGGGFELLNMTMIAGTLLAAMRFARVRDEESLSLLALTAVLLCQTRYESILIAVPLVLLVFWVWWREGRLILSWPALLVPLLMLPVPLQMQIFETRNSAWELASQPGYTVPFSIAYIPDNLAHALAFFFAKPTDHPNSLVFSMLGWLSAPFAFLHLLKSARNFRELTPDQQATLVLILGLAAQFGLMMIYFYGRFDMVIIRRLSLPTHFLLLLSLLVVLPQLLRGERSRWALAAVAGLGMLAMGIPSMAAHAYSQEYLPGRETEWRRTFIREQTRSDYLVIDNDSALWVSHRVSATPVNRAQGRVEALQYHLRNRSYSAIYVFQRLEVDPSTGATKYRAGDDLGPDFVLETVREERLQTLLISRISRVVEIRKGASVVREGRVQDGPMAPLDPTAQEKARKAYLENFLKLLP